MATKPKTLLAAVGILVECVRHTNQESLLGQISDTQASFGKADVVASD